MEKGDRVKLIIEDVSTEGQGIGKAGGLAVFVPETTVGDVVEARLVKLKKNYALGRVEKYIELSADRIEAACPYAAECGGCVFQEMDYSAQLALKTKQVEDKLRRLGGVEKPLVRPALGMEEPFRYRNKAVMPVSTGGLITEKGGIAHPVHEPRIGFYRAKSHEVVDCEDCLLQAPPALAAARALRRFMIEDNVASYDERWDKGLMRHLAVRTAFGTGEVMVVIVINGKGVPGAAKLVRMLDEAIAALPPAPNGVEYSLESVVLNIKKGRAAEVFGDEWKTLAGRSVIRESLSGLDFEISPRSFYQVNPQQMIKLYEKVLQYAGLSGGETVFDLYCGVGSIGLFCAGRMEELAAGCSSAAAREGAAPPGRVIGIEAVREAVVDANRNAVINGIVNAVYVCGRAEEELTKLIAAKEADGRFAAASAVAILDPPRAGCRPELLRTAAEAGIGKIIYVSCDPATMARDVKELRSLGYELAEVTPVDMFPWTGRIEAVGLLTKGDGRYAEG